MRCLWIRFACVFLALAAASFGHAYASSTWTPSGIDIALPENIAIPRDAPNGTVLWSSARFQTELHETNNAEGAGVWADIKNGVLAGGYSSVYQTSLPGIGVKWRAKWSARKYPDGKIMDISTVNKNPGPSGWKAGDRYPQLVWVELIKIGEHASGNLSVNNHVFARFNCAAKCGPLFVRLVGSASITRSTCQTDDALVYMGDVSIKEFGGIGSRSPFKKFSIDLNNCPSGISGVNYSIDPVNVVLDEGNSVIAINEGGAKGVGLQIQDEHGKPLALKKAIKFSGYHSNGGNFSIPHRVAYYQTDSIIKGGRADAAIRFTINYQ